MRLVYGVGINDADYIVEATAVGRRRRCPIYRTWRSMLERCYSKKFHAKYPTYVGCSVVPEWHRFSTFRQWMEEQPWEGNQLDKDILIPGNKVYGPETCVFVSRQLNTFLIDSGATRGAWPLGVYWNKQCEKFQASCRNPATKKQEHLGLFLCPDQAHLAWKKRKNELALQYASLQTDQRIAVALRARFI